ncbi:GNAT family N-acetyltransferase [Sideroxydans sp. CL21]|uniref:GNAT family N-acetyltransferase n=1 Tax=Sideroxydans sp. CL21 TaxID=2600596 RepID=UPI0024BD157A|nr:GNAT family N-acetyltransferase [Sideroxydans sp. CL21]
MNQFKANDKIQLRAFAEQDEITIENWPAYPAEFADLDYALRQDGWLGEFRDQPNTQIYVAEQSGELIAFTILSPTAQGEAEFRVALREDKTGQGLGRTIIARTLSIGFDEIGLQRVHLIVRKNNPRAIGLYQRLNFSHCGECQMLINNKLTDFLKMELLRKDYFRPITKGAHHIGLTVSRLEESADFFVSLLGWKIVRRNEDYPAIYVSDGKMMVTLWATKEEPSIQFDKDKNVGLHHVAFQVENECDLSGVYNRLVKGGVKIEFSPEMMGNGPTRHMMCYEPSGIRIEFIWPGR